MKIDALVLAGVFDFSAAFLHIGVIIGGAPWYRFFGAGEAMAALAERRAIKATLITSFIALVLFIWGVLAWSAAGIFPAVPFLKYALLLITAVYLIRGIGGLLAAFFSDHHIIKKNSTSFWVISSVVCIIFGLAHLIGLLNKWPTI